MHCSGNAPPFSYLILSMQKMKACKHFIAFLLVSGGQSSQSKNIIWYTYILHTYSKLWIDYSKPIRAGKQVVELDKTIFTPHCVYSFGLGRAVDLLIQVDWMDSDTPTGSSVGHTSNVPALQNSTFGRLLLNKLNISFENAYNVRWHDTIKHILMSSEDVQWCTKDHNRSLIYSSVTEINNSISNVCTVPVTYS